VGVVRRRERALDCVVVGSLDEHKQRLGGAAMTPIRRLDGIRRPACRWSGDGLGAQAAFSTGPDLLLTRTSRNPRGPLLGITDVALSDESLLAGLASLDTECCAAFVRRFQRRVFGLAYAILGDREAASDVAQEAFARAWQHAAAFDARRGSVSTWLLTITHNLAVDAVRLRRAVPMEPDVLASLQGPSDEPLPGEHVTLAGERSRLRWAVGELPEEQRRALLLAVLRGLSAREISELDGVPLGTVKTRIRSALLTLRSSMEVRDG